MTLKARQSTNWQDVQLGDFCVFAYGKSLPAKSRSGSGYPVYGSNGPVGLHEVALTSGNTIVIGRKGSFGEVHYSVGPCSPIDTTYYITREQTDAYLPWLARRLRGLGLNLLNRAAAIPGLNRDDAYRQRLLLPPLAEQKRIAAILDAADALRAKRRESLAQLDTLLQSTFLDMFGDPVTNPMGWEEESLGQIAPDGFRNGLSPSRKGHIKSEVLTLSAITRGQFDFSARRTALFDREPSPTQTVSKGTFLICRGNGNKRLVGTGVFPDRTSDLVCFPDTSIGVDIDPRILSPIYLQNVWRSQVVRSQIERGARTTNGTYKVNQKLLSSITFPLPPLDLQRRFATIVESVELQKARMQAHLTELDTLFASLQSRAFNGEL